MGQALSPFPTGALQIESSEETDQGKYECVATNSAGVRYSSPANLYVRGRAPRPHRSPSFSGSQPPGSPAPCRPQQAGPPRVVAAGPWARRCPSLDLSFLACKIGAASFPPPPCLVTAVPRAAGRWGGGNRRGWGGAGRRGSLVGLQGRGSLQASAPPWGGRR